MVYEGKPAEELVDQVRTRGIRALRAFPGVGQFRLSHLNTLLNRLLPFNPALFVPVWEIPSEQELLDFAAAFDLPIVVMHGMWPHIFNWSLLNVMARRANVLLDNSWHHTAGTVERIVAELGPQRILFATGNKAHNGAAMSVACWRGD